MTSAALWACAGVAMPVWAAEKKQVFAEELFAKPRLLDIKLKISAEDAQLLRKKPRSWVQAEAVIDGQQLGDMGMHLKGTTSFMPLDKKPSLTLSTDHYIPQQRFMGLHKFHLNNSVQDKTFVCESLAGELFHRAGVPRPQPGRKSS